MALEYVLQKCQGCGIDFALPYCATGRSCIFENSIRDIEVQLGLVPQSNYAILRFGKRMPLISIVTGGCPRAPSGRFREPRTLNYAKFVKALHAQASLLLLDLVQSKIPGPTGPRRYASYRLASAMFDRLLADEELLLVFISIAKRTNVVTAVKELPELWELCVPDIRRFVENPDWRLRSEEDFPAVYDLKGAPK